MTRRGHMLSALIFLIALTAGTGCISTMDDTARGPTAPPLTAYAACDFEYPDGSPVPCKTTLPAIPYSADHPGREWVCTGQMKIPDYTVEAYWNPLTGRFGIYFETHARARVVPAGGILKLGATEPQLYQWDQEAAQGFLLLPPGTAPGTDYAIMARHFHVNTSEATLADAKVTPLVSRYGDDPWYIYALHAHDTTYYFSRMTVNRMMEGSKGAYVPDNVWLQEDGFSLQILVTPLIGGIASLNTTPRMC